MDNGHDSENSFAEPTAEEVAHFDVMIDTLLEMEMTHITLHPYQLIDGWGARFEAMDVDEEIYGLIEVRGLDISYTITPRG